MEDCNYPRGQLSVITDNVLPSWFYLPNNRDAISLTALDGGSLQSGKNGISMYVADVRASTTGLAVLTATMDVQMRRNAGNGPKFSNKKM